MNTDFSYTASLVETIMDNTEDGIILFSPLYNELDELIDFKYQFVNKAGEKIIGKNREELLATSLNNAFPGHTYAEIFKSYKEVILSGNSYEAEQYYSGEGLQKWFEISAIKIDNILLVKFNDITGFKSLINEKNLSENLYRTLVKSLPHTDVALVDPELNILLVEGAPFKAFGFKKPIAEDSSLSDEFSHEVMATLVPLLTSCLEGKSTVLERENEGSLFRIHFLSVRDDEGKVFAALIVSEDTGIYNLSKQELRNKIHDLENSNQSLEQFAYVASHDLQEPLRKIRAFGDRLQSKYSDAIDDAGRDYISRMQHAAGRMQRLIDDLLKYSRIGRFKEPFQEISLQNVVGRVLEDLENRIEDSGAQIEVESLPQVEGDAGSLEQLFLNLLSNAIKFSKQEQPPRIKIWAEEQVDEQHPGEKPSKYNIFIQDDGIGFDEKYLDRIFNIFQRLHGRNEYAGTGIGLAICKKIADIHGGTIYARSTEGEGATFILTLPKTQQK